MVEEYYDATARYYAIQYGDDQLGDRQFYRELAVDTQGPVLEVGCGTGRIYLDLLDAGVDVDGIDLSAGMLDVLRENAAAAGVEPTVWQADVTQFDPPRSYDLVIIPFRAFLHLMTIDDQLAALSNVREALSDDGQLALNFFPPNVGYIAENYGEWQDRPLERDGKRYEMRSYSELVDDVNWIVREQRELRDADGNLLFEQTFDLKLVTKREFELLLRVAGFSAWSVFGGFDREQLESADQELVWIVER